jgi:hypothetical protein
MISVIMTAAVIAMVASQKIGQSELGGLGRGGSFVGICHYRRVHSLAEVLRCAGDPIKAIEPLVMRMGAPPMKTPARSLCANNTRRGFARSTPRLKFCAHALPTVEIAPAQQR